MNSRLLIAAPSLSTSTVGTIYHTQNHVCGHSSSGSLAMLAAMRRASSRETLAASFNHLVGDREQFVWNSEAESFSRLKIDD
jgi:hypothetical protein